MIRTNTLDHVAVADYVSAAGTWRLKPESLQGMAATCVDGRQVCEGAARDRAGATLEVGYLRACGRVCDEALLA
jgi:hypothetical protein